MPRAIEVGRVDDGDATLARTRAACGRRREWPSVRRTPRPGRPRADASPRPATPRGRWWRRGRRRRSTAESTCAGGAPRRRGAARRRPRCRAAGRAGRRSAGARRARRAPRQVRAWKRRGIANCRTRPAPRDRRYGDKPGRSGRVKSGFTAHGLPDRAAPRNGSCSLRGRRRVCASDPGHRARRSPPGSRPTGVRQRRDRGRLHGQSRLEATKYFSVANERWRQPRSSRRTSPPPPTRPSKPRSCRSSRNAEPRPHGRSRPLPEQRHVGSAAARWCACIPVARSTVTRGY